MRESIAESRRTGEAILSDYPLPRDEKKIHRLITLTRLPPTYVHQLIPEVGIIHDDNCPVSGEVRVHVFDPGHLKSPLLQTVLGGLGLHLSGEQGYANAGYELFHSEDENIALAPAYKATPPPVELMTFSFADKLMKALGYDFRSDYLPSYFDQNLRDTLYGALQMCIKLRIISGKHLEFTDGTVHKVDDEIFYPFFDQDPKDRANPYKELLLRLGMGPYTVDDETTSEEIREDLMRGLGMTAENFKDASMTSEESAQAQLDKLKNKEQFQNQHPRYKLEIKMSGQCLDYGTGTSMSYRDFYEKICQLAGHKPYRFPQSDNTLSHLEGFPNFEITDTHGNRLLVFFSRSTRGTFGVEKQLEKEPMQSGNFQ